MYKTFRMVNSHGHFAWPTVLKFLQVVFNGFTNKSCLRFEYILAMGEGNAKPIWKVFIQGEVSLALAKIYP